MKYTLKYWEKESFKFNWYSVEEKEFENYDDALNAYKEAQETSYTSEMNTKVVFYDNNAKHPVIAEFASKLPK